MITTTHALLNTSLFGKKIPPTQHWPLVLGAVLPDVPMFLYFLYMVCTHGGLQGPYRATLNEFHFRQLWVDWAHSIPLALIGALLCVWLKNKGGFYFFSSMFFHDLEDLPLHAEYAHRHFLPFSDWAFYSPVSYADPRHYGNIMAPLEWVVVLICIGVLWRRGISRWLQVGLLSLGVFQGLWLIYYYAGIHW